MTYKGTVTLPQARQVVQFEVGGENLSFLMTAEPNLRKVLTCGQPSWTKKYVIENGTEVITFYIRLDFSRGLFCSDDESSDYNTRKLI
jgi:hypothetical protein